MNIRIIYVYNPSMNLFDRLAESRIEEALQRGDFNNLDGAGKPLQLGDDSMVPEEYRMACRILKNAGLSPPGLDLNRQISSLERELPGIVDDSVRTQAVKKLRCLYLRRDIGMDRLNLAAREEYYRGILQRLSTDR